MAGQYGMYPTNGVSSLNTETGAITLVAGPGITITPAGQNITITNTEAAAPISIGPLDSQPENANGLAIAANVLSSQSADATHPGMVNNTTQSFSGNKTFTGSIAASNLSGTNTGDVTLGTANGLSLVGQVLSLGLSSTSTTGALSSTDWNTFNGKQPAGSYITALTGDGTASGPGSAAFTLATVNSNVGSFGSASSVGSFTVNGKGLITAASSTSIQIAESQVTNLVSDLAGKQPTGNYITALTGDVTATGPGSVSASLTATTNSTITTLSALSLPTTQLSGDISLTTQVSGVLPIANGGTDNGSLPVTAGGVIYTDGTKLQNTGAGMSGQVLTSMGSAEPTWTTPSNTSPTNTYWSGYFPNSTYWSTTSTTAADPTISGSDTLTQRTNNGIVVTAASSSRPGISFTPAASTSVYYITASFVVSNNLTGSPAWQLWDGTNVIVFGDSAAGTTARVSTGGIYVPGTSSVVNVTLQLASAGASTGTSFIQSDTNQVPSIEWSLFQIM